MSDNDPRFFLWMIDNEGSRPKVGQDVEVSEDCGYIPKKS